MQFVGTMVWGNTEIFELCCNERTYNQANNAFGKRIPATFCSNPQFVIKLEDVDDDPYDGEDGCTLLVGLMQKDGRKDKRTGRDLNSIGFVIYKYKGRNVHLGPDVLLRKRPVAGSKSFTSLRETSERFKLPPGEYVIIPSTYEPNCQGSFILRVFTEKEAAARELHMKKNKPLDV